MLLQVCSALVMEKGHMACVCEHRITVWSEIYLKMINPINAELYLICHLPALSGAHHILHIGRIRVNSVQFGRMVIKWRWRNFFVVWELTL